MNYYVNIKAAPGGNGTKEAPFQHIQQAAELAAPGDEVIVAPGIYRESVDPANGGTEDQRIVYRSEVPLAAVITGGEPVEKWDRVSGDVWVARVPNRLFGDYNPYTTMVSGDWFNAYYPAHTGDVFLNGKSLYEVTSLEKVMAPEIYKKSWDSAFTLHTWYTEQDETNDETVIYANFQGKDPNREQVEISARRTCFHPTKEGQGFITLSGFTVRIAATQWAPPTAYQEGMVGPHWAKGWIIEDCELSHSKCSGITLGKYLQPDNDNKWLKWKYKNGTQTERDAICQAQIEGWSKETIGSHIIRRCNIHDCGQTGIVGHLGCVFSTIEDNHIHHINNKQNLAGAEIGGIKLHAAIDVTIRRNHFHHCTRGLWLDWQAQGTRVSQNLFHDNTLPYPESISKTNIDTGEDIFIEVSHGPTLVDNNLLLSDFSLKICTQGLAFVHNFIAGSITAVGRGVMNGALSMNSTRYTPYHLPHRTEIAGFMSILHGDARFYNNVFVQKPIRPCMLEINTALKNDERTDANLVCGTHPYETYPAFEEYDAMFEGYCNLGAPLSDRYYLPLPVWAKGNAYYNGAVPMSKETDAFVDKEHTVTWSLEETEAGTRFVTDLIEFLPNTPLEMITTDTLGMAFEPEQKFENPDGTPIIFEIDYYGNKREKVILPGPFAE